jgi:hypothetical protein
MSKLEAKKIKWPNGSETFELRVHNRRIGHAAKVAGGWLVDGKRKPVETIEQAAKQCLDKAISQHSNEIQKLRAMLATVLRPNDQVQP